MQDPDAPRSLALPGNLDLFPTTACTVLAAVGVTVGWRVFHKDIGALPPDWRLMWTDHLHLLREPWRFLGATLPHLGWIHLIFNVLWMVDFGKLIEARFGSAKALGLFALCAVASTGAQVGFAGPGVGLSGVLYGCFGFLWVMNRYDVQELFGRIPRNTEQLLIGWFFLCIVLTWTGVLPVANTAHGYGALMGFLVGKAVVSGPQWRVRWAAAAAIAALVAVGVSTVAFPYCNWYYLVR